MHSIPFEEPEYPAYKLRKLSKEELIKIIQVLEMKNTIMENNRESKVSSSVFMTAVMVLKWHALKQKGDSRPNPSISMVRIHRMSESTFPYYEYSLEALRRSYYRNLIEFKSEKHSKYLDRNFKIAYKEGLILRFCPDPLKASTIFHEFLERT